MRKNASILLFCTAALLSACGPATAVVGEDGGGDGGVTDAAQADAFYSNPFVDDDGDGYTENQGDCDDNNPAIHPFAVELCSDGIDNNCNGAVDEYEPDADGDGFGPCAGDCDDTNPAVHPAAVEVVDGVDNNCDGVIDADFDGDGFTEAGGDCDDNDPAVNPAAVEHCYDGIDNDCNGFIDLDEPDLDGDGAGPCSGDCAEGDPTIGPFEPEVPGDGIDNNCDNLVDEDIDGDGWTTANGDCDDNNPNINPSVPEDCSDGVDNNCDGIVDQGCLSPCELAALTQSYLGCEFYAVDLPQFNTSKKFGIIVSNPSNTQTANVTITTVNGTVATWSIPPNGLQTYEDIARAQNIGSAGVFNRAFRISSDLPVAAYQFNSIDTIGAASTDASLLFATHSLAKRYYAMDYTSRTAGDSFVAVVGTEANTQVTLFPAATVNGGTTATLNPYDVMVVTATSGNVSLTGTRVEADKPVAVFGGNQCTNVPYGMSYCDHVEQQIFPRQAIGGYYIVGKTHARTYCDPPDYIRVLADADNTTVTFNPPVAGPWNLMAGQWQETTIDDPVEITATNPVLVGQFIRSSGGGACSDEGDPAFMLQVPVDQYRPDYVFLTPTTYDTDFMDIMAPVGTSVWLDNNPLTLSNTPIGGSGYSLSSFVIADGVHVLEASNNIGVMVYAYGGPGGQGVSQNVSYGYPAGLDLEAINPVE
ncbi:MAG: MopE-related protein [bacterium]